MLYSCHPCSAQVLRVPAIQVYEFEFEIMKHCFWNNCSFREAEASLSERGLIRPSAVLRASSSGSHSRVTLAPADADVSLLSSLGSVDSGVPSIVNAAKSLLSFRRFYDS